MAATWFSYATWWFQTESVNLVVRHVICVFLTVVSLPLNNNLNRHLSQGILCSMCHILYVYILCRFFISFASFCTDLTHSLIKTNSTTQKTLPIDLRVWKIEINFIMNEFYLFQNGLFTWFDVANVLKFIILSHCICDRLYRRSLIAQSRLSKRKHKLCAKCTWSKKWSEPKQKQKKIHKTKQHNSHATVEEHGVAYRTNENEK